MVFKLRDVFRQQELKFENDVKMYGIQTLPDIYNIPEEFENDVKMYGIQTKNTETLSRS